MVSAPPFAKIYGPLHDQRLVLRVQTHISVYFYLDNSTPAVSQTQFEANPAGTVAARLMFDKLSEEVIDALVQDQRARYETAIAINEAKGASLQ